MDLPRIEGRTLPVSIAQFERSCLARILEEQEKPNPDTNLIALLSNAVRLARESVDKIKARSPILPSLDYLARS